jgi:hypothetical protein
MDADDEARGIDTMIESARAYITELSEKWVEQ